MPQRVDAAGLAEDVEHGGEGELVVLEVGDVGGGPVEEEPGLLHRGVGFEDLVDGEGVPADGEGEEVGLGGGPGGGAEEGGDAVDCGAHVGFWVRVRVWIWVGFFVGSRSPVSEGEGAAMASGIGH